MELEEALAALDRNFDICKGVIRPKEPTYEASPYEQNAIDLLCLEWDYVEGEYEE